VTRHQATLRLSQGRQWPPSCCLSVTRHQATLRLSQGRQWPPSCCLSPQPGLWPRGGTGTSPSHGGSIHGTGAATPSLRACRTSFAKPIGSHMRRGGVYHAGCGFSKRGHGQLFGGLAPGGRWAGTSIFEPCCDMYMYDIYIHTTICILIYIHIHMYTLSLPLPLPLYVRFMITKPLNAVGTRPPPPRPLGGRPLRLIGAHGGPIDTFFENLYFFNRKPKRRKHLFI